MPGSRLILVLIFLLGLILVGNDALAAERMVVLEYFTSTT